MRDDVPRHQAAPPVVQPHTAPRPSPQIRAGPSTTLTAPTTINGREYESGLEVTPPGTLRPEPQLQKDPCVILPPPSSTQDDDPYGFDESESDNDTPRTTSNAFELGDPGRIPDFWGVVQHSQSRHWERSNTLRGMLSAGVYWSRRSNMVFTGQSALDASSYEARHSDAYSVPENPRIQVYRVTSRGLPRIPLEVDKLVTIARDRSRFGLRERAEALMLLRELHRVASRVIPELRDRAMTHVLDPGVFRPSMDYGLPPYLLVAPNIPSGTVPRPGPAPPLSRAMVLDEAAFQTLLHNRPGSLNATAGVAVDHAFRVGRRSIFGYALGWLLAPTGGAVANFRRQLAFLICLPHRYREAIIDYNRDHPTTPFSPQVGPTFLLHRARLPASSTSNISQQDVINVLLDNRIPPEWIDHAYPYGFLFLNAHYSGSMMHRELIDALDNERIARMRAFGMPPPIPQWDGWRDPSQEEIWRIRQSMTDEDALRRCRQHAGTPDVISEQQAASSSSQWLLVGGDGVSLHLTQRSAIAAHEYEVEHPVALPAYPALAPVAAPTQGPSLSSTGPESTNVDLGPPSRHMQGVASTNVDAISSHVPAAPAESTNVDPAASRLSTNEASSTNMDLASSSLATGDSGSGDGVASGGTSPLSSLDD